MWIRNAIPNLLTLGNLGCGVAAILLILRNKDGVSVPHVEVFVLMAVALVCDFLDGFAARALKATSPIGKELDSLADMVSFGVLPGVLVYQMLEWQMQSGWGAGPGHVVGLESTIPEFWAKVIPFAGLIIPLFSALRLAKFNVDTRQSYGFLGLPTPANALFFLSIYYSFGTLVATEYPRRYYSLAADGPPMIQWQLHHTAMDWLAHPFVLPGVALAFSLLLVSEIPLLAMKFKEYSLKGNWPRYALIAISLTLLAIVQYRAVPVIIVLYFLFSFLDSKRHATR